MRTIRNVLPAVTAGLLAMALAPEAPHAQLLPASPARAGLAGNGAAASRGHMAGLANPALLGQDGNSAFSLSLPVLSGVRASAGTGPITLSDIKPFADDTIPWATRRDWLQQIRDASGFTGNLDADIQLFGISFGNFALNAGTMTRSSATLPVDAAEILLFGNAGESGDPRDMDISGARATAWAVTYGALSVGQALPFHPFGGKLSIGASGKYVVGHLLADLADATGRIDGASLDTELRLPVVVIGQDAKGNAGRGFGLDVGAAWKGERLTLGITAHDVYNSFEFDIEEARIQDAHAVITQDSSQSQVAEATIGIESPYRARAEALVRSARFNPVTRIAAAYAVTSRWTVMGDAVSAGTVSATALRSQASAVGIGTELRYIPLIPLRAGFTKLRDGSRWGVGAGLHLLALRIDGAYGRRTSAASSGEELSLGVSILSRP